MRKEELLYLHQLLSLLRAEAQRRGAVDPEAFAASDDVEITPMAIYAAKSDHERAVRALAADLARGVSDAGDERTVPSV